ncbi:MAG: hypothetical protein ACREUT_09720 [Steroidobacteraceae bacterium]
MIAEGTMSSGSVIESSHWRMQVAGSASKVCALLVDRLAANPYLTVKKTARELGVAFTTVQRAVEKLQRLSIVTQTSERKRDRVYCATSLLNILEEPAQRT